MWLNTNGVFLKPDFQRDWVLTACSHEMRAFPRGTSSLLAYCACLLFLVAVIKYQDLKQPCSSVDAAVSQNVSDTDVSQKVPPDWVAWNSPHTFLSSLTPAPRVVSVPDPRVLCLQTRLPRAGGRPETARPLRREQAMAAGAGCGAGSGVVRSPGH